ncbi:MAG: hypothetical protein FWD83_00615 [Promicromonosporaceae bacterium]|nr:hypothetical protein [Promicromonosporaceae bacterium]
MFDTELGGHCLPLASAEDARLMRHYVDNVVRERARHSKLWRAFFQAADGLWQ